MGNEVKPEDFKKFLNFLNLVTNKQSDNLSIQKKTT